MSQSKSTSITGNTQKISPTWGCQPLFSSQKLGGQDVNFSYYRHPPYKLPSCCSSQLLLEIFLNDGEIERSLKDDSQNKIVRRGDVAIIPANLHHSASWKQEIEFLLIEIEPKLITQIAQKIGVSKPIEIFPNFACKDSLLYGIANALLNECQYWNSGVIYTASLLRTMVIHLIRKYSNAAITVTDLTINEQTEYRLKQALKYIDSHFDRHLPLEEVAKKINISKYHFCRIFSQYFGVSPYQYILHKRIDKAKLLLQQNPDLKMVDIALECGFGSQSHFNKQFRSFTGTTPSAFRQNIYSLI